MAGSDFWRSLAILAFLAIVFVFLRALCGWGFGFSELKKWREHYVENATTLRAKQLRIRPRRFYKIGPRIFGSRARDSFSVQYGRRRPYRPSSLPPRAEYMPQPPMQQNSGALTPCCRVFAVEFPAFCPNCADSAAAALELPLYGCAFHTCPSTVRFVTGTCFPDRAGTLDKLAQTKSAPERRTSGCGAPTGACRRAEQTRGWSAGVDSRGGREFFLSSRPTPRKLVRLRRKRRDPRRCVVCHAAAGSSTNAFPV